MTTLEAVYEAHNLTYHVIWRSREPGQGADGAGRAHTFAAANFKIQGYLTHKKPPLPLGPP